MYNRDLVTQVENLKTILATNEQLMAVLRKGHLLGLDNWYLGGGCIIQTVWNHLHGFESTNGIKDYDLVYFDPDGSYEAEDLIIKRGADLFSDLLVDVEIRNQARVHLWYTQRNGIKIEPYISVEHGISTWPVAAACLGVRLEGDGLVVFAPFGLNDLFGMTLRPNKVLAPRGVYEAKVERWTKVWPKLSVIDWQT